MTEPETAAAIDPAAAARDQAAREVVSLIFMTVGLGVLALMQRKLSNPDFGRETRMRVLLAARNGCWTASNLAHRVERAAELAGQGWHRRYRSEAGQ